MNFQAFLNLLLNLVRLPILSLIKLLILVLLLIPILIARLWEKLRKYFYKKNFKEKKDEKDCHKPLPEEIMRRPDPCIYTQKYLLDQGLPVTWDNPDIWLAKAATPTEIEPDSYHLLEDTDYIVYVKVHNASTDPAIGVKVRLFYKFWSFNVSQQFPAEVDANGIEQSRIVNIPPMSSTITQFMWHTPVVENEDRKHFCLNAVLSHPLDTNPANNDGQENTDVINVAPGQSARVVVPLYNNLKKEQIFLISAVHYSIKEESIKLKLKKNLGKPKYKSSQKIGLLIPTINVGSARAERAESILEKAGLSWNSSKYILKTKYTGFEETRERLIKSDYSLPPAVKIEIEGYDNGIRLAPGSMIPLAVNIIIRDDANPGENFPITLVAKYQDGKTVGGVTILVHVN